MPAALGLEMFSRAFGFRLGEKHTDHLSQNLVTSLQVQLHSSKVRLSFYKVAFGGQQQVLDVAGLFGEDELVLLLLNFSPSRTLIQK